MDNYLTALHNYAAKTDRLAQVRVSHAAQSPIHIQLPPNYQPVANHQTPWPPITSSQTPTPVSYTRHISRSLMLWLLTMPVCSVGAGCPWWITGLGTALVSLFLYSYGQLQ